MIYFTSDQHYYHMNVIEYCNRPFDTVEEMNEALVDNWNSIVTEDDTVYMLGDFSLAFRSIEIIPPLLKGKKYLVPGNHDFCHPYHKKSRKSQEHRQEWIEKYEELGLKVLPIFHELDLPKVGKVNLCHMPYNTTDPRYKKYQLPDHGRWLICGHVHEKWKIKNKMINVGVDVWDFKPVNVDTLIEIMMSE